MKSPPFPRYRQTKLSKKGKDILYWQYVQYYIDNKYKTIIFKDFITGLKERGRCGADFFFSLQEFSFL